MQGGSMHRDCMHKDEEIIHASKENVASLVAGVAAGLSRVESADW